MMKEKKKVLLILGVLIGFLSVVGISYAAWQLTKVQTGTNVVTTGCFNVEFTDKNPISLTNAYPVLDEDGKTLTPYEFTITNTCESEASYQVNLEILNDSTFTELGYIREMLNEQGSTSNSKILASNTEVEKTLENASSSYKLSQGVLGAKESKTFEFRLWMDQDTPAIPSVMNKELNSKITVITSLNLPVDTTNMMIAMDMNETFKTNDTYNQGDKFRSTLKKVVFENMKNPIADALEVKDFSVNQDESVLGYYVGNSDQTEVELHIQAEGKIKVNPNASYYFSPGYDFPLYSSYTFEGFENLDTSEVINMSRMFYQMNNLKNLDLSTWNTLKVTDMSSMFEGTYHLTELNLSNLNTTNVTNMSHMFDAIMDLTSLDLSDFDTSNVTDMSGMFHGMSSLTSLDISNFNTSNVTNMNSMFDGVSNLTSLNVSSFDTSNVTDMSHMFGGMGSLLNIDLSHFNTRSVTNMYDMFRNCNNLTSLDLSSFDTSNVTNMNSMFINSMSEGVSNLTSLNVSSFDTSNVTDMGNMFYGVNNLTSLDISNFDTSSVTNMSYMFNGMSSLTSLDISSFDTSNVTNMSGMFSGLSSLTSLDISNFDTLNVTNMNFMFSEMSLLSNLKFGENFTTFNVIGMIEMFSNMTNLTSLDVSSFDTLNTRHMNQMFMNDSNLTNIIYGEKFIYNTGARVSEMFNNCPANKPTHESWSSVTW